MIVRVPASSANLGPGFDSFGIAWQLYNEISFQPAEKTEIFGCGEAYRNEDNLALRAYRRFQPWGGYVVVHVDGGRVEAELHYGGGAPHRYLLKEAPKPQP